MMEANGKNSAREKHQRWIPAVLLNDWRCDSVYAATLLYRSKLSSSDCCCPLIKWTRACVFVCNHSDFLFPIMALIHQLAVVAMVFLLPPNQRRASEQAQRRQWCHNLSQGSKGTEAVKSDPLFNVNEKVNSKQGMGFSSILHSHRLPVVSSDRVSICLSLSQHKPSEPIQPSAPTDLSGDYHRNVQLVFHAFGCLSTSSFCKVTQKSNVRYYGCHGNDLGHAHPCTCIFVRTYPIPQPKLNTNLNLKTMS